MPNAAFSGITAAEHQDLCRKVLQLPDGLMQDWGQFSEAYKTLYCGRHLILLPRLVNPFLLSSLIGCMETAGIPSQLGLHEFCVPSGSILSIFRLSCHPSSAV